MQIINNTIDFHFVQFPITLPILYGIILYAFPNYENILIYLTIFLLAETHFAATWPFFLDKVNTNFIITKRIPLITIPILIIFFSIIGFFLFKEFFILMFYALNIFHVMRQSFGVCKLYIKNKDEIKYFENLIYFFNFLFFIIGFIRFYNFSLINDLLTLNIIVISLMFCSTLYLTLKFGFSKKILTFLTGILIFYPACFVNNAVHVILMGVTMHYSQYLVLTYKVTKKRSEAEEENKKNIKYKKIFNYFGFIFFYSFVMTYLTSLGKSGEEIIKQLIIIPMIGQIIHFYIDSQLWKFSDQHNRENVLKHILH